MIAELDPCLNDLVAIFECFDPEGSCSLEEGGIVWSNGSKLVADALFGPNGQLCGKFETIDGQSAFSNPAGQTWVWSEEDDAGNTKVTCPGDKEVSVSAAQTAAASACLGQTSNTSCLSEEDIAGGSCTTTNDCKSGQVCCEYEAAGKFCVIELACPQ